MPSLTGLSYFWINGRVEKWENNLHCRRPIIIGSVNLGHVSSLSLSFSYSLKGFEFTAPDRFVLRIWIFLGKSKIFVNFTGNVIFLIWSIGIVLFNRIIILLDSVCILFDRIVGGSIWVSRLSNDQTKCKQKWKHMSLLMSSISCFTGFCRSSCSGGKGFFQSPSEVLWSAENCFRCWLRSSVSCFIGFC